MVKPLLNVVIKIDALIGQIINNYVLSYVSSMNWILFISLINILTNRLFLFIKSIIKNIFDLLHLIHHKITIFSQ